MPDWIKHHLSLRSDKSLRLSSEDIYGLMEIGLESFPRLERTNWTSELRINLTSIGLGRCRSGLNLPKRKQSLMLLALMLVTMDVVMEATLFKSEL